MGSEAQVLDTHRHLGRERGFQEMMEYESPDEYADQDDERVVKFLQYPYHVLAPSPMIAGEEIIKEKVAMRGDTVYTDELGPYYLQRGESMGAFFTSAELEAIRTGAPVSDGGAPLPEGMGITPAEGEGVPDNFAELGSHEMAEYLDENQPNVDETLALVAGDPEAAKRLLEAENIVTDDDPRTGVVKGIEKIVST